ncbi:hypothetical protein [Magnetospirillum gryphiswaldense]|nr:hypothetical protein [Magnetospirillum gryphiswaldense]AVM74878.1 hypothetical protein MSR1_23960 [Magnetospirillum gryphiswaldense MSR-1]AVM78781.1 hypothetical protein MSR1L_23960 [Magnetospirillum gryphiswaldense]
MPLTDLTLTDEARIPGACAAIVKARAAVLRGIAVQRELIAAEKEGRPIRLPRSAKRHDASNRRPRRWWFVSPTDGGLRLNILYGHRPVALRDGLTTIVCDGLDGVVAALGVVAANIHELDAGLASVISARPHDRRSPRKTCP